MLPTGTVTFLFTDIEGSTRLFQEHPAAMNDALARHHAILQRAIESHNGYVFQIIGDAFCAAFGIAPHALSAALAAQCALRDEHWAGTGPLRVRMGLHTGSTQVNVDDVKSGQYSGYSTLARAQRIMSAGHGGQVLLSNVTAELARGQLPEGITLRDLGEHRLKGIANLERLWQMVAPGLPAEFPPLQSLNAIPNNLPAPLTSFIGRETELADIGARLDDPSCRLLTLVGAGGMGKTRLALEAARRELEQFPAGIWLTELARIDRSDAVPAAVAGALGVQAQPPRPITDTIIDALQTRVLLLVIDNCEHVLDGTAHLAAKILEQCPEAKVMTTSREPLHIAGEYLYTVPGLLLPEKDVTAEQLADADSVRLFVERATAVRPGFALDANSAADVIAICRSLDGMPLAIELGVARVRMMSPNEIAARLDNRFRLLTCGQRAGVPHHQTLQATIGWSYELLTEAERAVFNRLSVFRGGCTLEAAERVCAGHGIASDDIFDLLTNLVDKSMVVADTSPEGATRYRLLETLRQYGHERLIEIGQDNEVCQRHAEHYTELAEQLEAWFFGSRLSNAHEHWLAEEDNMFAAMGWLATYGDGVLALRLGGAVHLCIGTWSYYRCNEYLDCLLKSLARGSEIPAVYKAKALIAIGLCYLDSEPARALTYLEQSLELARQSGNRLLIGLALFQLARSEMGLGRPDLMRIHATECMDIGRETNAILLASSTLLGALEPPERRLALLEEFLAAALKIGSVNVGYAFQSLAQFVLENGDLQRAGRLFEESYYHYSQHGDRGGPPAAWTGLGRIALLQGDYARATSLFEKSRTLWRAIGWEGYSASPTRWLGVVAWCQGDYETAARRYQECYEIARRRSDQDEMAVMSVYQAVLLRDQGECQRANTLCGESLEILRQINWKDEIGWALSIQASIAQRLGEHARAIEAYQEGLRYLGESSNRITKVGIIEGLGVALASASDYVRAARLLAFAEFQRNTMGIIIPPPERPWHEQAMCTVHQSLDEAVFAEAWVAGHAMTLEQAIADALTGVHPSSESPPTMN